jgi:tetratricopeptide (TPR) repeat protein
VDMGRSEALLPWADVIAQLSEQSQSLDAGDRVDQTTGSPKELRKLDYKKLAQDSASAWALAVPLVGGAAYAAIETTRLVKEQGRVGGKLDLRKLVRDAAPAWAWALPFVGDIAHAAAETVRLAHTQKQGTGDQNYNAANQQQVFQQYVNLLSKISLEQPLVIFLDDLHWADASSCGLLAYLARQIGDKRILVIGTYRQEDAASANEGQGHPILKTKQELLESGTGSEQALGYLTEDTIVDILRSSSRSYSPDPRFASWLHRISDGNALFVTQYIRTLREDTLLTEDGAFTGDYERIAIPRSALAVVEERTRRLAKPVRELLTYATAEGEEFTSYVLSRITERAPADLLGDLQHGIAQKFIESRGSTRLYANQTTELFGFSHSLFHKALYGQLITEERDYLHRHCFQVLTEERERLLLLHQRATPLSTKLLLHAEKCEEWATVAEVALEAAGDAWHSYAEAEALTMTDRTIVAANAIGDDRTAAEALFLRSEVRRLRGHTEDALEGYRSAERLFRSTHALARAVDAINAAAWTEESIGRHSDALAHAQLAIVEARDLAYEVGEADALGIIGNVQYDHAEYDNAQASYTQSLERFISVQNAPGEVRARKGLGNIQSMIGAYDASLAEFLKGLEIVRNGSDRCSEATILNSIGVLHLDRGDYRSAIQFFEEGRTISASIGDRWGEGRILGNMGNVHSRLGEFGEALACYERVLPLFRDIGDQGGVARCLLNSSNVHAKLGATANAISALKECYAICIAIGETHILASAHLALGNAFLGAGELVQALDNYEKCRSIAASIGDRWSEAAALGSIGIVKRSLQSFADARLALDKCMSIAIDIRAESIRAMSLGEFGLLAQAESDDCSEEQSCHKRAEARNYFMEAASAWRAMGMESEAVVWEVKGEALQRDNRT